MGTSSYFGELKDPKDYLDARPNLTVGLKYFVHHYVSLRGEVTWFQLSGTDAETKDVGRKPRNLSFISNNYEVTLTGALNLFPAGYRFYQRSVVNFYGFGGVGLLRFNPTAKLNGVKYALQPLKTEGVDYNRTVLVIPYGIGGVVKIGPFFNLSLEGGYRLTFTDYLDDVSTVHPDKSSWSDPIAISLSDRGPEIGFEPRQPGAIRGNPNTNDGYFLLNVKVEYYLPSDFNLGSNRVYRQKRKAARRR